MLKPMSFRPARTEFPAKCTSASASFPGGLPLSFGVNLMVTLSTVCLVCIVLILLGTVIGSFVALRNHHELPGQDRNVVRVARGLSQKRQACPGSLARPTRRLSWCELRTKTGGVHD